MDSEDYQSQKPSTTNKISFNQKEIEKIVMSGYDTNEEDHLLSILEHLNKPSSEDEFQKIIRQEVFNKMKINDRVDPTRRASEYYEAQMLNTIFSRHFEGYEVDWSSRLAAFQSGDTQPSNNDKLSKAPAPSSLDNNSTPAKQENKENPDNQAKKETSALWDWFLPKEESMEIPSKLDDDEAPRRLTSKESSEAGRNGEITWAQEEDNIVISDVTIQLAAEVLSRVEGFYPKVYLCQAYQPTIGFGFMTKRAYTKTGLRKMKSEYKNLSTKDEIEDTLKVFKQLLIIYRASLQSNIASF